MEKQSQSSEGWIATGPLHAAPPDSPRLESPSPEAVEKAVRRILSSPGFASAPRRSQLFTHLVERQLAGTAGSITEYALGVDIFGRPPSFDPRLDSIVRTEVSRLRARLREYYDGPGKTDPVRIEIPPRGYAPSIAAVREATVAAPAPPPAAEAAPPQPPPPRSRRVAAIVLALAGAAGLIGVVLMARARIAGAGLASIVVLPFQDYSPARDAAYLADGITEELTNELAQDRELRVVARTSALVFKNRGVDVREIGRRLNVGAALEGSLSKDGDAVRVTAQLNRTSDGYHLWSHSYVTPYRDVATVQAQITQAVRAAVLKREPGAEAPKAAVNPEAHELYLEANYQLSRQTPESLAGGLELFQRAVSIDASYVDAYRGIARAEIARIHFTAEAPKPAFERAHAALMKALEIRPGDAESLGQLADVDYVYYWDWPRAEREFRLASEHGAQATTHSYYGWSLATRGRFEEARKQFEIAQDLDPLGAGPRFNQAMSFLLERRFEDARRVLQESIDENRSPLDAHLMLGVTAMYQRNCAEANRQFQWFADHFPRSGGPSPVTSFGLALGAACNGNVNEARQFIAKAQTGGGGFASPYQLAMAHAAVGDADAAMADLKRSADAREGQIFYIKYDPAFDGIRGDRRFKNLMQEIGLN